MAGDDPDRGMITVVTSCWCMSVFSLYLRHDPPYMSFKGYLSLLLAKESIHY